MLKRYRLERVDLINKKIKGYNRCRHHDDPEKYITKIKNILIGGFKNGGEPKHE